ncbi:MAG: TetR/AcrR family transcriptional regulator [Oscillospiraceae bacterium]|nr:TetR/AcrR family transcriptional regulator [Oscillospiraceae bacterium]
MPAKKQKLIEYNRSNILDAARKLFLAGGLEKTSVDEIAKAADCSKATIYAYFKSKEDIYYSIVLEYMSTLRDGVKSCFASSADYERAYNLLCWTLVRFEKDYPMYFECILGKISTEKDKCDDLPVLRSIFDVGEEINWIVCDFLERGKADGFIKQDIDPLQATFVMWSSLCGLISLCSRKQSYMENSLGIVREDFLRNGFAMILGIVRAD